ncbi:MAG: sigma-54-dependent Fis family transcriptional regulator [Thermodesulfobacteria bacterium]|nr:sigma-54-dependent Fis family transcriptional regulator [Thermodesulfobacteriota bacterium]
MEKQRKKVLVIDDEAKMRRILQLMLEQAGYEVMTADSGEDGIEKWMKWQPDVVLTDLKMPKMGGMEILDFKNKSGLSAPLIILTAYGTIPSAVEAIKKGAFEYLTKPFDNNQVKAIVAKALEQNVIRHGTTVTPKEIIGSSKPMRQVLEDMAAVANTDTSVLITGESGTGKELVARGIHAMGNRRNKPFVKVNCAAIPKDLLESELFGHKKGAFTGATQDRTGKFLQADKGVLFLDEVGDLPLSLQPKLLNAVEEKMITPVGSSKSFKCDVKIISATNQDLKAMVEQRRFRQDLHYRLNIFNIHIPPLRERKEDIPLLVDYFLKYFCNRFGRRPLTIDPGALQQMQCYPWPGNVRELRNVVERMILKCRKDQIGHDDLPEEIRTCGNEPPKADSCMDLHAHEKHLIIEALEKTGWNQVRAAKLLGITRNTLRYRMKKYAIIK